VARRVMGFLRDWPLGEVQDWRCVGALGARPARMGCRKIQNYNALLPACGRCWWLEREFRNLFRHGGGNAAGPTSHAGFLAISKSQIPTDCSRLSPFACCAEFRNRIFAGGACTGAGGRSAAAAHCETTSAALHGIPSCHPSRGQKGGKDSVSPGTNARRPELESRTTTGRSDNVLRRWA